MNIHAINLGNSTNTSFNGLLGDKTEKCVYDTVYDSSQDIVLGTERTVVSMSYYPFKDESDEKIKKKIASYQLPHIDATDVYEHVVEHDVKVMPRLDITEGEYKKYLNSELLSKDENRVDDILKKAGLYNALLRFNIKKR